MYGTLIIYILTVSSSYLNNIEIPSGKYFDVFEFWITDAEVYRIKTFSKDMNIHVHHFAVQSKVDGIKIAEKNTHDNYGDIIKMSLKTELNGKETQGQLNDILKEKGIKGKFEINDFVFWNPDGRDYRTASKPESY